MVSHREKLISGFGGALAIFVVFAMTRLLQVGFEGQVLLIASMGASAVLLFAAPHSPLAQPRNVIVGHLVSALIGVVVLFVRGDLHDLNAAILGFVIVVFSYVLFASMVNTTIVTADESEVRVRSGPLPLWPAKAVASAELEQLFVVSGTYRDPPREHSVLTALLKDGSRRALLVSAQGEDLLFIEKTVERRLGIVDRPVPDASAADRQA